MSIAQWKVALEDLGLSAPTPTDAPEGKTGDWFNAQTRFERRGFVRVLVGEGESLRWWIEAAHPALVASVLDLAVAALAQASGGEWSYEQSSDNHFVLEGETSQDTPRQTLVPLLLFADAVAADRDDLGDLLERLEVHAAADDSAQADASTDADPANESEDAGKAADSSPDASVEQTSTDEDPDDSGSREADGSPFESIGSDSPEPLRDRPFVVIHVADDHIELGMGLPEALDADSYDRVLSAWGRSLRGRYDVRVEPVAPDAIKSVDLTGAAARIVVRVTPDALTGSATIADIAPDLHDHIDTLEKVTAAGIDPLVFLGVRDRPTAAAPKQQAGSPFETIGSDSSSSDRSGDAGQDEAEDDSNDSTRDDSGPVFFVADDSEDDGAGGLVLDLTAPPAEGDALEPGRFDDPRLDANDATTQLVDVVLRHPGYSDRRIGQVLSILLSVDYADALDLASAAPRVIAWGVGNDRAQTMKTVIEGAGGKVLLVEPDTFAPG